MWPESQEVCISLIHCDEASAARLIQVVDTNRAIVRRFPTALSFLEQFDPSIPGCAIADFDMPDRGGWELVDVAAADPPGIQIIFFAATMDVMTAVELMKAGVSDVVLTPLRADAIKNCIAQAVEVDIERKRVFAAHAAARRHYTMLTPREREVFHLVVSGLPSKGIAHMLDRSQKTVEVHRTSIMKKMAAKSVVDLVRIGIELNVLDNVEPAERRGNGVEGSQPGASMEWLHHGKKFSTSRS